MKPKTLNLVTALGQSGTLLTQIEPDQITQPQAKPNISGWDGLEIYLCGESAVEKIWEGPGHI